MDNGSSGLATGGASVSPAQLHQLLPVAPAVSGPFVGWAGFGSRNQSQSSTTVTQSSTPSQQQSFGATAGVSAGRGQFAELFLSQSTRYNWNLFLNTFALIFLKLKPEL